MKIYIDSDIILDVLLRRRKFHTQAEKLLNSLVKQKEKIFTSALAIANIHYILKAVFKVKRSRKLIQEMRPIFNIIAVDQESIDKALISDFNDFEDAIQYYACTKNKIDHIITRNKRDFKPSQLPVSTPAEFLALIK